MLLVSGEVAFSRRDGTHALAERFDQIGGQAAGENGFLREFGFDCFPHEDGLGDAAPFGKVGEAAAQGGWKFACKHTHGQRVIPKLCYGNTEFGGTHRTNAKGSPMNLFAKAAAARPRETALRFSARVGACAVPTGTQGDALGWLVAHLWCWDRGGRMEWWRSFGAGIGRGDG